MTELLRNHASSGTTKADAGLGPARVLLDGEPASLAKDGAFASQQMPQSLRGGPAAAIAAVGPSATIGR